MSLSYALVIFFLSLALSVISSVVLSRALDKVGARLGLAEGLLGLVTALGADAPEISTAVTALIGGQHDVGVGVVLGSNVFNLAALLGLSAVVAGRVRIHRQGLQFNGIAVLVVTVAAALLILGLIGPIASLLIMVAVVVPYVVLSGLRPRQIKRLTVLGPLTGFLSAALADVERDTRKDRTPPRARWTDILDLIPALVSIVLASIGMVRSTTALGHHWNLSRSVIGILILASITGIPNVVAAVRLAQHRRGSAVVSESLNSNTLNILAGIAVPALVLGLGAPTGATLLAVWWLLGMTLIALVLTGIGGALMRPGGSLLILLYAAFAVIIVLWPR